MKKRYRNKKEMEYEDAPSGCVTLYNYKEPFMKLRGGFGYEGVLLFDTTSEEIQCHFCGNWYGSLPHHLKREHNMSAANYKKEVGLLQSTALLSESARAKLIASGLDKRLQNLRIQGKKSAATKAKISATIKENQKNRLEIKNITGTCPEQLISRLQSLTTKLGHPPRHNDVSFRESITKTFGSMKKAFEIAGIPYHPPGLMYPETIAKRIIPEEQIIEIFRSFLLKEKRFPKAFELKKQFGISTGRINKGIEKAGGINTIIKKILAIDLKFKEMPKTKHLEYTKKELIGYLKRFEEINKRRPSYSDAKRGLLPALSTYSYRFGGWQNALKEAFND